MKSNSRENSPEKESFTNKNNLKQKIKIYNKELQERLKVYEVDKTKLENLSAISREEYKTKKKLIKATKKEYKKRIKENIIAIAKLRNSIEDLKNQAEM